MIDNHKHYPSPIALTMTQEQPCDIDLSLLGKFGDIVARAAKIAQVDKSLALQSFLSTASLLAQSHINVEIDSRIVPCTLFMMTVAESGERKSSINTIALEPVIDWQERQMQQYRRNFSCYQIAKKRYDLQKDKAIKDEGNGQPSIPQLLESCPTKPRSPQLIIEEPTYEAIIKHVDEEWPSIGLISDEAGRLVGGHAMNKENRLKFFAGLSSLWDGKSITRSRQKEGSKYLSGRRVCCHLMMQPCVQDILLKDSVAINQGFLARFLIVYPPPLAGTRMYQKTSDERLNFTEEYKQLLQRQLETKLSIEKDGSLRFKTVKLAPQAKALWVDFYNAVECEMGKDGCYHAIKGFASKGGEHAIRIAGVLAFLDNPSVTEIPVEIMQQALMLMRFYLSEQLRFNKAIVLTHDLNLAQKALDYILTHHDKGFISTVEVQQNKLSRESKKSIAHVMRTLEEHHHIIKCEGSRAIHSNNRRDVWRLNPYYLGES